MSYQPWVRVDSRVPTCPELAMATAQPGGDKAALVFLSCLIWAKAYTTDGYIPHQLPRMFRGSPRHFRILEDVELWIPGGTGWITLWFEDPKPATRPHIPLALRRAVYARDDYQCVNCGATDRLSLDHIEHWSTGGPDTFENLRTLCLSCNSTRRNRTDDEWLGVSRGTETDAVA